jgi:p25-alpha
VRRSLLSGAIGAPTLSYCDAQLCLTQLRQPRSLACPRAGERHNLRATLGIAAEEELRQQFLAFANFGIHTGPVSDMDGAHFAKYCSDCKLLGKSTVSFGKKALTLTDVDLTFAKAKAKGSRRLTFDQFLRALGALGEKQGASIAEVVAHCLRFVAPVNNAKAVAEDVRLHDDKVRRPKSSCSCTPFEFFCRHDSDMSVQPAGWSSALNAQPLTPGCVLQSTYTGVYSRGGPTNIDRPKDLSGITNRKPANNRGVALPFRSTAHPMATPRGAGAPSSGYTPRRPTPPQRGAGTGYGGAASFMGSFMGGASAPLAGAHAGQSPGQSLMGAASIATTGAGGTPRTSRRPSGTGGAPLLSPLATENVAGWENLSAHRACGRRCLHFESCAAPQRPVR